MPTTIQILWTPSETIQKLSNGYVWYVNHLSYINICPSALWNTGDHYTIICRAHITSCTLAHVALDR